MSLSSLSILPLSLLFLSIIHGSLSLPTLGVTYTPTSTHTPEQIATTLRNLKLHRVRLPPETDPNTVRAFSYSNISLLLTLPNNLIPAVSSNRSAALQWLYRHVIPFYPRAHISTISVGTNILDSSSDLTEDILPAIRNVHLSLHDLGIHRISVSTTLSFINVMTTAFPPSSAEFQEPVGELLIKPLLQFLKETNSSFLMDLYPYNVYRMNSEIPIGFALFQEDRFNYRDDTVTGVRYRNLFDMMVDSVVTAMAVAGHENIPIAVVETGWPSGGGESDANEVYAELYLKGLVKHLNGGLGTPLRKEGVAETYIYELFDDANRDTKIGKNWGVLYSNLTKKYKIDFSGSVRIRLNCSASVDKGGFSYDKERNLGFLYLLDAVCFSYDKVWKGKKCNQNYVIRFGVLMNLASGFLLSLSTSVDYCPSFGSLQAKCRFCFLAAVLVDDNLEFKSNVMFRENPAAAQFWYKDLPFTEELDIMLGRAGTTGESESSKWRRTHYDASATSRRLKLREP
ncbi:Glycoside hydrolase family 17 [Dillenia turbinata]|uniref:Glycoside hydrolase family 17 n=1 Tax=Dillenia turbinata TaxID=194707 RepID=A0AAN8ZCS3_9MAGN